MGLVGVDCRKANLQTSCKMSLFKVHTDHQPLSGFCKKMHQEILKTGLLVDMIMLTLVRMNSATTFSI